MYEYLNFGNDHFNYFLQYFDVGMIFLRFFKPNKLYIFGSCMVFNGFNQHWQFLCFLCMQDLWRRSEQWIVQSWTVWIVQSVNSEGYEIILQCLTSVRRKALSHQQICFSRSYLLTKLNRLRDTKISLIRSFQTRNKNFIALNVIYLVIL